MVRCDTSADGEASFIIGEIIWDAETRLNETFRPWIGKWDSAVRSGRRFFNGLAGDAEIVRNCVGRNYENALTALLGLRMALDFAFNGFEFTELFVPFSDGDIEDALSRQDFFQETPGSDGWGKK